MARTAKINQAVCDAMQVAVEICGGTHQNVARAFSVSLGTVNKIITAGYNAELYREEANRLLKPLNRKNRIKRSKGVHKVTAIMQHLFGF